MIVFLFFDNPGAPGCKDPDVQVRQGCQNIKRRSLISSRWIYWYDPVGVYSDWQSARKNLQEWQQKYDMATKKS
jgi:hypothetical protein